MKHLMVKSGTILTLQSACGDVGELVPVHKWEMNKKGCLPCNRAYTAAIVGLQARSLGATDIEAHDSGLRWIQMEMKNAEVL